MNDATNQRAQRFQELDAFRGIAASWVVLFHFIARYQDMVVGGSPHGGVLAEISSGVRATGALPVKWFFMISGFVIVWTLDRCRNWQDFALSRFSRLHPTYWAAMTL